MVNHDQICLMMRNRDCVVSCFCGVRYGAMGCSEKYFTMVVFCNVENQIVVWWAALWRSAVRGVVCSSVVLSPRSAHPLMNMNGSVQLIANPSHVHPHRPHPKAHHSALSHSVSHDNQKRDYGDQINYGLIQNAMVLTTVNPGLPKHWRQLITLILLVYAAEASVPTFPLHLSQERGSGLSSCSLLILPFIYDDRDNISAEMQPCAVVSQFSLLVNCFKCLFFMR